MPEKRSTVAIPEDALYSMVHAALELPESYRLEPGTRIADVPGWDSLGWVSIITAVEAELDTELDIDRIDDVASMADLVRFVQESAGARDGTEPERS